MFELIIITSLLATFTLHVMYKWKIKNPLNCDFCLSFWLSLVGVICFEYFYNETSLIKSLSFALITAMCSSVVSFYVSMRINMYAGNK